MGWASNPTECTHSILRRMLVQAIPQNSAYSVDTQNFA